MKKYPKDSPIPNWPYPDSLKKEDFSMYCGPVNQAIIDGLRKIGEINLLNKFLSSQKEKITEDELDIIKKAYSDQINYILLLSEMKGIKILTNK